MGLVFAIFFGVIMLTSTAMFALPGMMDPLNLDSEIQLIKLLLEFPNIIGKAKDNLEPQTIATYLQSLAGLFHKYYAKERVVTDDKNKTSARLILVQALQIVLNNGLSLLGIHALERM